ncbi:MAG TPA: hypothetical protein VFY44_11940 [Thermoleophilaceae bacterium]|nr:hypothetical protein [Thermoleophilaceae bacterium]
MRRSLLAFSLAVLGSALGGAPAMATELVDNDKAQCPSAAHTTIQAGVDAASANEQVLVCNGVYREQVTIDKDGIDLVSKVTRGATIKSPVTALSGPEALVHVDGGSNVKVRRFTIAGPGPGTVDSLRQGVLVENNNAAGVKEAQITDNLIQDIRDTEAAANEEGVGVRVGRAYANTSGRASVLRNTIIRYQRGGVVVDGDGSFAAVATNTITGLGLLTSPVTPVPAQQGIQVGSGTAYSASPRLEAAADINSNRISLNQYSGGGGEASIGILVLGTDLAKDPRSARVSRIQSNKVFKNDYGVYLLDVENHLIRSNRVYENGDSGTAAPDGGMGAFETSPGAGNNNRFDRNDARTNDGLDCEDGTSPLNTWTGNRGVDDSPSTICAP